MARERGPAIGSGGSLGTASPGHESPVADAPGSGRGRVIWYLPIALAAVGGGVVGFLVGTEYGQATDVGGLTGAFAFVLVVGVAVGCVALVVAGLLFLRFLPRIPIGRALLAGAAGLVAGTFGGWIFGPSYVPGMEVAGRLTIVLDEPAVTLEGEATCSTAPNTRTVASVTADPFGEAGGHRLFAAVHRGSGDGSFDVALGQHTNPGDRDEPAYVGQPAPLDLQVDRDWGEVSFRFEGLAISTTPTIPGEPEPGPLVGVDWPSSLSGRVEWTCDEVPN